jgi:GntR family transcriptional regulator
MASPTQITIDSASPVPAYRQIVDQLRVLVVDRKLLPGSLLPPVRTLARELSVHHNTVAEAYRTLAAEGLIAITHGRGATVAGPMKAPAHDVRKESLAAMRRRLREMVAEYRSQGLSPHQIATVLRGLTEALDT